MEILIIGGSRFLGPILIEQLLKNGHSLSVFNRGTIKLNILLAFISLKETGMAALISMII